MSSNFWLHRFLCREKDHSNVTVVSEKITTTSQTFHTFSILIIHMSSSDVSIFTTYMEFYQKCEPKLILKGLVQLKINKQNLSLSYISLMSFQNHKFLAHLFNIKNANLIHFDYFHHVFFWSLKFLVGVGFKWINKINIRIFKYVPLFSQN